MLNVRGHSTAFSVPSFLPVVEGTISSIRQRLPGQLSNSGQPTTSSQYNANLGITSWEIDFFGRIRSLSKRALEEYFGTEHARRSAQILLVSEVANAYLTLAADRENLQLSRSTLEAQQASYNLIRRRFEVGLAPQLDLRQVQTRVDTARVDVARFSELAAQDENALNLLVGSTRFGRSDAGDFDRHRTFAGCFARNVLGIAPAAP